MLVKLRFKAVLKEDNTGTTATGLEWDLSVECIRRLADFLLPCPVLGLHDGQGERGGRREREREKERERERERRERERERERERGMEREGGKEGETERTREGERGSEIWRERGQ